MVRLEDGRQHRLEHEEIGADQLAHGYATTVHRSQGATHDIAHVYEDGGGRELAYVAMSRARDETHVYLCADDLDQAREDLSRSWATERRWKWAIDTGTPEVDGQGIATKALASLEREALKQEQAGLYAALPRYLPDEIRAARDQCRDAEAELSRLRSDNGVDWGGAISQAGQELHEANRCHRDNQWHARSFISRVQARLARSADLERIAEAQQKLDRLRQPEEPRLLQAREGAEKKLADLLNEATDGERWWAEHPEVMKRQSEVGTKIYNLHATVDGERWTIDKELNPRPEPERSPSAHRPTSTAVSSTIVTTGLGCEVQAWTVRVQPMSWSDVRPVAGRLRPGRRPCHRPGRRRLQPLTGRRPGRVTCQPDPGVTFGAVIGQRHPSARNVSGGPG